MSKFLIINFALYVLAFVMKRFHFPFGSLLFIVSTTGLMVYFAINASSFAFSSKHSTSYRGLVVVSSVFLCFTLVGIMFRHQWWPLPFYSLLFQYLWPIGLLIVAIQFYLYQNKRNTTDVESQKSELQPNMFLPLIGIVTIALATFFTSQETFCKVFKPYTSEELQKSWESKEVIK